MVQRPLNNLAGEQSGGWCLTLSKLPEGYLQDEIALSYNAEFHHIWANHSHRVHRGMARTQILLKSPIRFLNLYQCNILGGNRLKINATALCAGEQKDHSKCREGVIHTEGAGDLCNYGNRKAVCVALIQDCKSPKLMRLERGFCYWCLFFL